MPGLLADITGCERLYAGELNLLKQLLHAVHLLGFQARVAAASTFGCAWAVARFGPDDLTLVEPNAIRDALHDLPVRALRVSTRIEARFAEVGVTTVGQLLDLPRRSLPSRFGEMLTLRIDQALGQAMETITPIRVQPPVSVVIEFAGPVKQQEAIELAAQQLLQQLCDQLLHREAGVRQLDITLKRSDCPPYVMDVSVSRPSRNVKHLWTLLRPKLERAHLGFGVESITMIATAAGALPHRQHDHPLLGKTHDDASVEREFAQLTDTLSNRFGAAAVCRITVAATHQPERVMRLTPAADAMARRQSTMPIMSRNDRPSVLLPSPRPIRVNAVTPDGPLVQMQWRGQTLRVLTTIGPERITADWWRTPRHERTDPHAAAGFLPDACGALTDAPDVPARDYFKVQDETGRWWWVYRQLDARLWFVHGGWI